MGSRHNSVGNVRYPNVATCVHALPVGFAEACQLTELRARLIRVDKNRVGRDV